MSVAVIASLGRRRVTVVAAIRRGIVRVLLVLRVGRVVLGVDRLLPDLVGRSWSGGGISSASDDAASKDCGVSGPLVNITGQVKRLVSLCDETGIDLIGEEGSTDKGVGATEVHEQFRLNLTF